MGIFNKGKKLIENLYKAASIKVGQTTKEVFDTVERDEFYTNNNLESNAILHSWTIPEFSRKFLKDDQIVCVQLLIQNGIVVDGSHFRLKDRKEVEYILKDGLRDKKQNQNDNDDQVYQVIADDKFEFDISRDKFNCRDEAYIDYLFETIQYYDEDKPFAFISYSSKDKEKVWSDVINLQIKGYNLWIDKNMKETENSWQDSAFKALDNPNCKLVIFYLSRSSITSAPCLNELKYRENKSIPYIVVEAKDIGPFDSFIKSLDENDQVLNDMHPHFVSSSKKRIKFSNEKENTEAYFSKIENNLNVNDIKQLSNDELYSKAVKVFGETGQEYSAIALLDYCYSQGYLPAAMLRAFIKEKPIFNDYFVNNKNIGLDKLQKISQADEWLKMAENYKGRHMIEQAAAFYSAYALVNNDIESYKQASNLWGLTHQNNEILLKSCSLEGMISICEGGDWRLEENGCFFDLFDLKPLSFFAVRHFKVSNKNSKEKTDAFDIVPNSNNNGNKKPVVKFEVSQEYMLLSQIIRNYYYLYRNNELFETTAGYYATQLAIWGRFNGFDPSGLTIISQNELASKIRNLASALYNDSRSVSAGTNFIYNGGSPSESYTLTKGENLSIYYYDGAWYYRSEKMVVTNYGTAGNLNFTVSLDGEGFITDSSIQIENKTKTMTFGSGTSRGNIFYVFIPVSATAGETTVYINTSYNYADVMTLDFSSGTYGFGQMMMGIYKAFGSSEYTVKFIREAAKEKSKSKSKYKAKINFTKTGLGVSDYSTTTVSNEILYCLTSGQTNIDTYLAFYTVEEDGTNNLMGKGVHRTSNGQLAASNLPLAYIDENGKGRVLVCEIDSPAGYGQFKDDDNPFEKDGHMYSCFKYVFNTANADSENLITRDITEEDSAKTFTINVYKKDQNGAALSGYNFGLYTTKEIVVSGKTSIPVNSLVAYAITDDNGALTFNSYLPANQNYVLKEIGSEDKNTTITINGNITQNGTAVILDVLENATVAGYDFNVTFINTVDIAK